LHAEHLLEKFPTHRLADRIQMQLSTLQENAEIQERQELEVRIQELIHDHQFDEAIELAEDVVRRFPLSPQAESLEKLLPRIRELAREGVQPSASSNHLRSDRESSRWSTTATKRMTPAIVLPLSTPRIAPYC
jgi:hypothetical protein